MPKFTKGQSGNPGGRPKEIADLKALARVHTELALKVLVDIIKDKQRSGNARVAAAREILDRGYGKPAQAIEHGNLDNAPLVIQWLTPPAKS